MQNKINIFWFRRDLRLEDNVGLHHALESDYKVLPIFIFDINILDKLEKNDARVTFIFETLQSIKRELKDKYSRDISIYLGNPIEVFSKVLKTFSIKTVYTNHDYEPYGIKRDQEIENLLLENNIEFKTYKDQVIFEKDEVVKKDGKPYVVYTPYMRKWKEKFKLQNTLSYSLNKLKTNLYKTTHISEVSLLDMGFSKSKQQIKRFILNSDIINNYEETRNFPSLDSTSKLGPHLRFGTISIRKAVLKATSEKNEIFWQELIWREFFMQILWHFPSTKHKAFKSKYDSIEWRNDENDFKAWCEGKTGYPLVDAGMRQLNATGFMHNRVRMLVGSFLCKHLLIDWKWGEAYFASKLHDYEMASNVGNWQWVAGSGVDASPYFRIFNPTSQIKKFDKDLQYIKKWVPEFQDFNYPKEIIDHKFARERCLEIYKKAVR